MDNQKPIFKSLAMIEERIQEKLTVESLAQDLHFSRYHYQRLFREAVGESVMRYVARRKISLAAEELTKSESSILEIALRYGYDSHEGFTRSFKAHMGVTPAEYRKYHLSIKAPNTEKERCAMLYSKTTDEIIRELNNLIVQANETIEFTEKTKEKAQEITEFYGHFLDLLSRRTQELTKKLSQTLEAITDIAHCPDQISARFVIIKTIEDAAFWSNILLFQARLTIARAKTEHQAALMPVCRRYEILAENSQMKAEKVAGFFSELSALIFHDMRENAGKMLQNAIHTGKTVGQKLLDDPALPYAYIGEELLTITQELSSLPLERITISFLDDCLLRTDIIAFSADFDMLRAPSHKTLFEEISRFREELKDVLYFFQSLSEDILRGDENPEKEVSPNGNTDKHFLDLAFQGNILLFFLKGEVLKLGSHLDENQQATFDAICSSLNEAILFAQQAKEKTDAEKFTRLLEEVHKTIAKEAEKLSNLGAPMALIADEIGRMANAI